MKGRRTKPQAKGYSEAGASVTRRALRGFIPNSGSPAEDIDRNNDTLRQRSRMLYMSSPVATAAIDTSRTKIVGTGLTLKSALDRELLGLSPDAAKSWQKRAESEWRLWCKRENCDALGLNSFLGLQQLALKSWLTSGDVFALVKRAEPTPLNPYSLRLHLIEADRVCTPPNYRGGIMSGVTTGTVPEGKPGAGNMIYDGVEVDADGRVAAYYVCSGFPTEYTGKDLTWERVLARGEKTGLPNVLHIMNAERPDQYRGVPQLAPVIEPLLQLRRYTESELMAALVQSFFTAWIETETSSMDIPFNEVGPGDVAPSGAVDLEGGTGESASEDENEYELGPGTVFHLKEGEKVVFGNPNIPTAGFEIFFNTMCRMVGAALETPADVILKKFDASYSASRGALLEAWETVKMRRTWFVDDFCQPIYEIWLAEAVARGRIRAAGYFDDPLLRSAWSEARWIGPVQGQLDPLKEAKAALLLVQNGIKTHEQVTREMGGGDWEENVEQLARENELLKAAGGQPGAGEPSEPEPEDGDGNGENDEL